MTELIHKIPLSLRLAFWALLIPMAMSVFIFLNLHNVPHWSLPIVGAIAGTIGATVAWYVLRPLSKLASHCSRMDLSYLDSAPEARTPEIVALMTAYQSLVKQCQAERDNINAVLCHISSSLESICQAKPLASLPRTESFQDGLSQLNSLLQEVNDKLQKSRARLSKFSQFLQEMPIGLLAVEKTGVIRYSNKAAERIFGKGSEELVAHSLLDFVADTQPADLLGRDVLSKESLAGFLHNPKSSFEAMCTLATRNGARPIAMTTVSFPGQLIYVLTRDLSQDYSYLERDRARIREQTLRALLGEVIQTLSGPLQGIVSCSRLLTSEIKQAGNRDALVNRAKSIRHQANVANVYLRIVEWLSRIRWGALPEPLVSEFAAVEPVRWAVDTLTPLMRDRDLAVVVTDQEAGYICGDSAWVEMAILGLLYHAAWAAKGLVIGIGVARRPPSEDQLEDLIVYSCVDLGPALTEGQLEDLNRPYGGLKAPSYLFNTDGDGFMPGLMLAEELCKRLGGKAEWKTTPSGHLAAILSVPTRQPFSCATLPVGEIAEVGPLDELVMGWKLAHA